MLGLPAPLPPVCAVGLSDGWRALPSVRSFAWVWSSSSWDSGRHLPAPVGRAALCWLAAPVPGPPLLCCAALSADMPALPGGLSTLTRVYYRWRRM